MQETYLEMKSQSIMPSNLHCVGVTRLSTSRWFLLEV